MNREIMLVKEYCYEKKTKNLFKSVPIKDMKYVPIDVQVKGKDNFVEIDTTLMIIKSLFDRLVNNQLAVEQLLSNDRRRQYNLEGA